MKWPNELVIEFLKLYENQPVIWNPKLEHHKNRSKVADAWAEIQTSLSVCLPIEELKKKRDSLMSIFRNLLNKVKCSVKSGSGKDDLYEPNWFAYEMMAKFLNPVYFSKRTTDPLHIDFDDDDIGAASSNCNAYKGPPPSKIRKITLHTEKHEEHTEEIRKISKDNISDNQVEDECSLFCELLCKKLKSLDKDMRDVAMHEIDCLMFRFKQLKNQQQTQAQPTGYEFPQATHTRVFSEFLSSSSQSSIQFPTSTQMLQVDPLSDVKVSPSFHTQSHSTLSDSQESSGNSPSPNSYS